MESGDDVIATLIGLIFFIAILYGIYRVLKGIAAWLLGKSKQEKQLTELDGFSCDYVLTDFWRKTALGIDETRGVLAISDKNGVQRIRAEEITDCEVIQDGNQIAYTNRGSQVVGMAVGGALLGGIGAVIGGLSGSKRNQQYIKTIKLQISTTNMERPNRELVLLDYSHSKKGASPDGVIIKTILENAQTWHGRITNLMKRSEKHSNDAQAASSSLEKIERLASLRERGALTDDEYEREKQKLLQ